LKTFLMLVYLCSEG